MDIFSLPTLTYLSDNVTICQLNDIKVVRVNHPLAQAAISLHGGHLIAYKPTDQNDIIWLSEKADLDSQHAIRGGIPVCWPWFGKVATPSHGFARNTEWKLNQHRENEEGVIISLTLESNDETLAIWPHQFSNELQFEIGSKLNVSLITKNTDETPWSFSGALHSYFNISDISQISITDMGQTYQDSTQNGKSMTGDTELTFDGEVDRVYSNPAEIVNIHDVNRTIAVKNSGSNSAVIWNPWKDLSHSMADMADDSYQTMVCVEATVSSESPIELAPQQTHILSTEISIK
ncbi:D-hexose-6-phosphate mutarotase [Vibrio sp. SS-MA-C1-2]|uniref:D-hexose-6-phosphate mutarotase n=1 Tax=Vibrio sp. SS-MA-C1-2 TaxID=2908646 RepID=UPI001F43527F|nr:D-hexose-6-phosphate mutarotase [Vibrio sp. SS-MA-C1-2]UJF19851.1 D-hexose-6-phosphate mutarotase [Vibrio sp. SS-MA-C1-2]